jgi:hypothetical protein
MRLMLAHVPVAGGDSAGSTSLRGSSPENMRLMLAHVPVSVAASDLGGIVPVAAEGRSWSA